MGWLFGVGCVLVVILAAVLPLVGIWSLNTLFGLGIAYGVKEWGAAAFLIALLGASSSPGGSRKEN